MKITVDMVMNWEPCIEYTEEKVKKLLDKGKTPQEVAKLKIPVIDKIWALLHPEIMSDKKLHKLACRFAEDALKRERKAGREPDYRSWAAIEAKRKWLRKEITDKELSAAWSAARFTARSAAWSAAYKRYLEMILKILEK